MNTCFKCALCLFIILAACAAEPQSIILETPIASATPFVTAAPTDVPTRKPPAPTRTPKATIIGTQSPISNSNALSLSAKININTAGEDTLVVLPHIGTAIAQRIIAYRQEKGPFKRIEDIQNVSGIGEVTFDAIKGFITVE
jgi:competence protein ComEA